MVAATASAQLPSAVRREPMEWTDSTGAVTRAIVWSPMGTSARLPTIVFSPGFGLKPSAYSVLLSVWASRGFVVVGVEHPAFRNPDAMELYDASQAVARQLTVVLDHVIGESGDDRTPLSRVDPNRIGVAGHSVGGSAAVQAAALAPQYRAAMNLDGTMFGPVVHTGVRLPVFLLRAMIPPPKKNDPPVWFEHRGQGSLHEDSVWTHTPTMYWLSVQGLDHMSFTDAGLDETRVQEFKNGLASRLSAKRAQEMATRYAVEFFGFYLNGGKRPLILNDTPFPKTILRRKP
jgi:pimeloyl-ACP methyl ester carboxylesterase